ncbi:MAG TPA: pilus assembly PilX N-terminal domain-containing protein [Candidatus Krumholzibacteria bacterium]|nr:pilus assembly PilX N-terminal domain-containing protein [Candidatus Krumholzibacteria bacterium]
MNTHRFDTVTRLARDERGNVLVIALLLMFATFIIGGTVVMLSGTDLKIAGNQELGTEAHFAAEAGIAEAVHRLSLPYPTDVVVGGNTINGSIADMPPIDPDYRVYITLTTPAANPSITGSTMTAGTLQNLSGEFIPYSRPAGTDEVLTIEHKWRDIDGDGVREDGEIVLYDPSQVPPENLAKGNPIELVTVTGRAGASRKVVQVEVTRLRLFVKTLGALYTDKAVDITGNSAFCGWNHDIDTPSGTKPNACFAYHLPDGHLAGVTTTGDIVDQKGAADIEGSPSPTNTDAANPWYTLPEVLGLTPGEVNEILASADNTSAVNPLEGVTYIQGNATINSNVVGHGLLYVTGDLTVNGGFKYWGLIYVEGDCKITGAPWIEGTVMVKGSSDFNFNAGNAGVLYSEDAITQFVGRYMPMVTLAWRDL